MSKNWADIDSDSSDDETPNVPIQHAGLNDGTIRVSMKTAEYPSPIFIFISFHRLIRFNSNPCELNLY